MHHEHGARGFSFDIEEAPARAQDLGRLDLDWSDLGAPPSAASPAPDEQLDPVDSEPPAPSTRAPRTEAASAPPGARTPLMPHAAAAGRNGAPRALLAVFAAPDAPTTAAAPATAPAPAHDSPPSPQVRRLRFPAAVPAQTKASPRPSTRFADSIGRSRPTADSVSDLSSEAGAPPEDLPARPGKGAESGTEAGDEPAPPAVLLRRASALLSSAKETARDLSGRGLESGRLIAGQMSEALRERLERKSMVATAPNTTTVAPRTASSAAQGDQGHRPPPRRSLRALARQGTGPILALVAALGMFLGSRHIIGSGAVGLSKTNPVIPDLGEVKAPGAGSRTSAPAPQAAAGEATKLPSGPPPAMATEFAPLPPGMAWPGKGLLEVVTSEDELVYVDGVFTGRGPLRRVPVTPGEHEVSIRKEELGAPWSGEGRARTDHTRNLPRQVVAASG